MCKYDGIGHLRIYRSAESRTHRMEVSGFVEFRALDFWKLLENYQIRIYGLLLWAWGDQDLNCSV